MKYMVRFRRVIKDVRFIVEADSKVGAMEKVESDTKKETTGRVVFLGDENWEDAEGFSVVDWEWEGDFLVNVKTGDYFCVLEK